jgi:transposase-like protein
VRKATRPAIFKWRQTAPELIVCARRWYLRYSLSLRDVEELLNERGLEADHTTVWREGYEAMHMIRKGQARWVSGNDVRKQNQFIDKLFDLPA